MNVDFLGGLGVSAARLGHRGEAEALAKRPATINPPFSFGRSPYWRARIAALLGDRDRAVALLQEAIAQGISCAARYGPAVEDCHREMDFESLRGTGPSASCCGRRGRKRKERETGRRRVPRAAEA